MAAKKKYVARHELHLCDKPGSKDTKPKITVVRPQSRIMLDPDDDEVQGWVRRGAVIEADKDDNTRAINAAGEARKAPAKSSAGSAPAATKKVADKATDKATDKGDGKTATKGDGKSDDEKSLV